ncbi:MAG TPA: wax ester/triacylglycerol synthase family O-acyltransferase [Rubrivivax sp.]|nr:wax ester/triacylglycerol synthase family O-acyltransferase [Rubrivivax sp.]
MTDSTRPMSRVDTAWLRMDSDVNLMMIVGVWLLRPAIDYDALCSRIQVRLLCYERFRQKVVQGALGSQWVEDEHFDLGRHVVVERLRRRRGQSERSALQERMGELASVPLDHAHPLWQFQLIEHFGAGSALICRIHHCIGDGVALNSVMMSLCDDGVTPRELAHHAADPHETHLEDWVADELLRPLTDLTVKAIGLYGNGVVQALKAVEHPRRTLEGAYGLVRDGKQLLDDVAAMALMPNDSPTRLKGHGSGRKRVAWCEPLPLEEVKAIGKALGASVNDVLLCTAAGAIGRWLGDTGDDPAGKDIRALVPVNLRPLDQAWQLGNRFGLVPLLLPVGTANPLQRLRIVHERMTALKRSFQPLLAYGILGLSGLLVQRAQDAVSSLFLDKTTAVMTNVPGPTEAVRLCGSEVVQSIFWVPSSGNVGVGVSIISYAGGVQFGLVTDEKLCPEPDRIIERFALEFEQLLLLALMLPWPEPPATPRGHARRRQTLSAAPRTIRT